MAALTDLHAAQTDLGLEVEGLRSREARDREPMLSPRVRVGLFAGEDHRADTRTVVAALLRACDDTGVRLDRRHITRLERDDDRVVGATIDDGTTLRADRVVLAAGAWSASLDGVPDELLPR